MDDTFLFVAGIQKFNQDRNLFERGFNQEVELAMLNSEYAELLKAIKEDSLFDYLDALADLSILSIGAILKIKHDQDFEVLETFKNNSETLDKELIDAIESSSNPEEILFAKIGDFSFMTKSKNYEDIAMSLFKIMSAAFMMIYKVGADPYIVMDEAVLEINSRSGSLNESTGKWEKCGDGSYSANYEKALMVDLP